MNISKSPIKEFCINNLHYERDVKIPFNDYVQILVAENGLGKTTVLNALYNLMSGNFKKLRKTQFDSISVEFYSGKTIKIYKEDLNWDIDNTSFHSGMFHHLRSRLSINTLQELHDEFLSIGRNQFISSALFQNSRKTFGVDDNNFYAWIDNFAREIAPYNLYGKKIIETTKILEEEFPYDLIYLPTYRRIEEELNYVGEQFVNQFHDENIIKFGMGDVREKFSEITAEIVNSSVVWFSKVNGQMLTQLIEGVNVDSDMQKSLNDPDTIKIVLDRVGNNITQHNKDRIIELVTNKEIFENSYLAYFMANLLKVYSQQIENDKAIKKFSEISNKYLGNKEIIYDESSVKIDIVRKKNKKTVPVETLSSGEKQIISLFSRLFLEKHNNRKVAIFFDEPELSLSLEWQKQLLPHIIESGICEFLFCTTHSPFIFENDLISYANDLGIYIKER